MSPTRFNVLFSGVTSIAQKVYGVVPKTEPWALPQIHAEFARTGGSVDRRVLQGCLRALTEAGLVNEKPGSKFMCVPVRPVPEKDEKEVVMPEPTPAPKPATSSGLTSKLSLIAARANAAAESLRTLADDIELAALEIEDRLTENNADSQKLKQLQQLLKSISG